MALRKRGVPRRGKHRGTMEKGTPIYTGARGESFGIRQENRQKFRTSPPAGSGVRPVTGVIALAEAGIVTGIFAALAYRLGMVSRGGAAGGFAVGVAIYAALGPAGFSVLALFVICASVLTKVGYARKLSRRVAEAGRGRRGARNALANCAVAVICALLAAAFGRPEALTAAFVAAIGAAFADTVESELGQLAARRPRLITSLRSVPPGTDGAVSLPGTLAGVGAAALTAGVGAAVGLIGSWAGAVVVALAAFAGTLVDSWVGAVVPRAGNELTNVLCTLSAAALAALGVVVVLAA